MPQGEGTYGSQVGRPPKKRSAFKMKGFTPFTKMDPPVKQEKIKKYIKTNMIHMSDKELMKKVNSMSDGKTTYNWNPKTGEVESIDKTSPHAPRDYYNKIKQAPEGYVESFNKYNQLNPTNPEKD